MREQLAGAGIPLPQACEVEIAELGLGHWEVEGLGLVVRVNEPEYCSKWITLLPGQECPKHYHKMKKETFLAIQGVVELIANGETIVLEPGDQFTIKPGVWHSFSSKNGAVIEEVSTHDENSDSYFENKAIVRDPVIEED